MSRSELDHIRDERQYFEDLSTIIENNIATYKAKVEAQEEMLSGIRGFLDTSSQVYKKLMDHQNAPKEFNEQFSEYMTKLKDIDASVIHNRNIFNKHLDEYIEIRRRALETSRLDVSFSEVEPEKTCSEFSDCVTLSERCNVCMESREMTEFTFLECSHRFCDRCVRQCKTCPMCRTTIRLSNVFKIGDNGLFIKQNQSSPDTLLTLQPHERRFVIGSG